jgi:hypothetical protein
MHAPFTLLAAVLAHCRKIVHGHNLKRYWRRGGDLHERHQTRNVAALHPLTGNGEEASGHEVLISVVDGANCAPCHASNKLGGGGKGLCVASAGGELGIRQENTPNGGSALPRQSFHEAQHVVG